jgi:perosamine synthetase
MIPLAIPRMTGREAAYLNDCVETNFVSSVGSYVDRFEAMVAEAAGAARTIATSAGTTGLHAALTAVGVDRDDLVILPSFTFIASANAIAHCGAEPWLFDIDAQSWTLDVDDLAIALKRDTERRGGMLVHRETGRRVAAVMPVFTLGQPADMDPIVSLARNVGLPVVVDGAAALGALYKGRPSGALGADLTVYSFNGNKTVTAGGGGAVAGDDAGMLDLVKHLTTTARAGADYTHDRVGFNYRMTNLQAAVGCAQMESLDDFVARKREIATRYTAELTSLDGVTAFPDPEWAESACWFSGVVIDPTKHGSVGDLRDRMREAGIDARPFWKPVHLQAPYAAAPQRNMDVSEALWSNVLTLPCSTGLTDDEQTAVIACLRRLLPSTL